MATVSALSMAKPESAFGIINAIADDLRLHHKNTLSSPMRMKMAMTATKPSSVKKATMLSSMWR